jgi:hypothetical protein
MTSLIAAALLATQLAAAPADAAPAATATPAKKEATPAPAAAAAKPAVKPAAKQEPASAESLADARGALMGPCNAEMAKGKVTAIEVVDGVALNALLEKEKSTKAKADPYQRFMLVSYTAGGKAGKSTRQVSTQYNLTTEQAKVLVGEKLCAFKE